MLNMAHKPGEISLQAWTGSRLKDALDRLVMDLKQRDRVSESRQATSGKSVVNALLAEFVRRDIKDQEAFLTKWLPIYEEEYYAPSRDDFFERQGFVRSSEDAVPVKQLKNKAKGKGKPA